MITVRKAAVYTGIIVGVLVLMLLSTHLGLLWISEARLQKKLAELRAAGEPVTLKDLERPPLPPEKNAAVYLNRAEADMNAFGRDLRRIEEKGREWSKFDASDYKELRAAVNRYPQLWALLDQAAACLDHRYSLDYDADPESLVGIMTPWLQSHRAASSVLRARAYLLLHEGKREEALRTCLTMFRLARSFEKEPTLLNYLVVAACRAVATQTTTAVLQAGSQPEANRQELDKELAFHDNVEGYRRALQSERVWALAQFGMVDNWLTKPWFDDDKRAMLDVIQDCIDVLGKPSADTTAIAEKRIAELSQFRHRLTLLLLPALQKVRAAANRSQSEVRSLRVLNATQRFTELNPGKTPSISDLGLPSEATIDPVTGKPLLIPLTP